MDLLASTSPSLSWVWYEKLQLLYIEKLRDRGTWVKPVKIWLRMRCPLKPSPGQKKSTLGYRMWPHKPCPERLQSNKENKKCPTCFLDFIIFHPSSNPKFLADKVHNTKLSWTRTTVLSSWCNHHYLSSLRHLPWWRQGNVWRSSGPSEQTLSEIHQESCWIKTRCSNEFLLMSFKSSTLLTNICCNFLFFVKAKPRNPETPFTICQAAIIRIAATLAMHTTPAFLRSTPTP